MLTKFASLFRGSALAHGTYDKQTENMATLSSPASEEDFKKHLNGELGLGIVPVNEQGLCYFGAIDVDIDTIDHKELYGRVASRKLPLSVCRSKSGGAHLYIFFRDPQQASFVQNVLKKYAALLGFPNKTEIFPKQIKSAPSNIGNWINLPYFNSENTVRYCVRDQGSITLEEFLNSVQYYTGKEQVDESLNGNLIQISLMPPCLQQILEEGLGAGQRNAGLFSIGVFYQKSSPNGWQDKLRYHNQNYVSPPLPSRELEALIKSLASRKYQYKCDEEPCVSHCDRKTCLTMQYGIGNKSWEDENNFDEMTVQNLRKILTDPPTYIVEVNSKDIHLSSDEFRGFEKFRKRLFEVQDMVVRPIKQAQWEQKIKVLFQSKIDIEAPDDASNYGAVSNQIDDFLAHSDRAKGREDLLRGMPILEGEKILFRVDFLQKYLVSQKTIIQNQELFAILHQRKCAHDLIKIKGKNIRAWSIPASLVNRQTEEYTDVVFEKEEESEV